MGKKKHDKDHVKHVCLIISRFFSFETHADDIQDVGSRQTCTICRIDVNVSTGGPKNFEAHLASKKHLMNVKAAEKASKTLKPTLISNFFVKRHDIPPSYQPPPAPQLLDRNAIHLAPAGPSCAGTSRTISSTGNTDTMDVDATLAALDLRPSTQTGTSGTTSTHPLVSCLRAVCASLPSSVPVGQESEPFAAFSGDPRDSIVAGDDPWESVVDPCLNRVIGFGMSTHQIADTIRRGPYGIDGFCQWIEICMVKLKISPELLEIRLERVLDALKLLYVSFLGSLL